MQDPRAVAEASQIDGEREEEEYAVPDYFPAEEIARVEGFLGTLVPPFTLSEAIQRARNIGLSIRERHLIALRLVRYFGETDDHAWNAEATGRRVIAADIYGDELKFEHQP